ncbi:hypothetical protein BDK51DRAFT_48264 [Blyttiomyces helicus]|uniref:Uncharacterized protein n=1 Tax=Blyttiomyces helicus TaxID=388810 RepID=A0A4P9VZH5_9FUNG|nr:hypothetical protein BDK51DRAFT_48264 [Blyttiomyces helicus]|eukprot:RKO85174.1 hypothetical protein BDK51DRAFT_48264 [Blyttiomyces helicus]
MIPTGKEESSSGGTSQRDLKTGRVWWRGGNRRKRTPSRFRLSPAPQAQASTVLQSGPSTPSQGLIPTPLQLHQKPLQQVVAKPNKDFGLIDADASWPFFDVRLRFVHRLCPPSAQCSIKVLLWPLPSISISIPRANVRRLGLKSGAVFVTGSLVILTAAIANVRPKRRRAPRRPLHPLHPLRLPVLCKMWCPLACKMLWEHRVVNGWPVCENLDSAIRHLDRFAASTHVCLVGGQPLGTFVRSLVIKGRSAEELGRLMGNNTYLDLGAMFSAFDCPKLRAFSWEASPYRLPWPLRSFPILFSACPDLVAFEFRVSGQYPDFPGEEEVEDVEAFWRSDDGREVLRVDDLALAVSFDSPFCLRFFHAAGPNLLEWCVSQTLEELKREHAAVASFLETFPAVTHLGMKKLLNYIITSAIFPILMAHALLHTLELPTMTHFCEQDLVDYLHHGGAELRSLALSTSCGASDALLDALPSACPRLACVDFGEQSIFLHVRFRRWLHEAKRLGVLKVVDGIPRKLKAVVSDGGIGGSYHSNSMEIDVFEFVCAPTLAK